jgi:hypothetical protein
MKVEHPPFPRWAVKLAVVGVLFLVGMGSCVWFSQHVDQRWSQAQRQAKTMLEELPSFDGQRPVLWGDSEGGNAWDDYAVAVEGVKTLTDKDLLESRAYREKGEAHTKVVLAVGDQIKSINAVRKGAHRSAATWDYKWENGGDMDVPFWNQIHDLVEVEKAYIWMQLDVGETRKAVEAQLDALQLARDGYAGGTSTQAYYALQWLQRLSEGVFECIVCDKMKPGDLDLLDRGLQRFEASWPPLQDLVTREGICAVTELVRNPAYAGVGSWRHGFSGRLTTAEAIDLVERALRDSAGCDDQPWPEVDNRQAEIEARADAAANAHFTATFSSLRFDVVRNWRKRRAQYRLLRVAAHYRATGEVLALPDPLGTTLQTKLTGRTLKVWSAGPGDQADDAAKEPDKDYTLEVTRP